MASTGDEPPEKRGKAEGSTASARARNMVSVLEAPYELSGMEGTFIYKRLTESQGEVREKESDEHIGTFSYAPIASTALFNGVFQWDEELSATQPMPCIGVTSSEIMRHTQLAESAGAYFVLPSQLNGAEYPSDVAIIREVEDYIYDNTGGPRGQLSTHPGAAQFVLSNAASWANEAGINAVDGILAKVPQFKLKNGYLVMPTGSSEAEAKALFGAFTSELQSLRPLVMHDVQACGLTPDKEGLSTAKHRVGLVYASAVPVNAYCNKAHDKVDAKLHRKIAESVLVAQYYGALRAVAERQPGAASPVKVFLLPLGGGVFNNSFESIATAMALAVELLVAQEPALVDRLEIEALAWSGSPAERGKLHTLLEARGKLFDSSTSTTRYRAGGAGPELSLPPLTTQKGLAPAVPPPVPMTTQKGLLPF